MLWCIKCFRMIVLSNNIIWKGPTFCLASLPGLSTVQFLIAIKYKQMLKTTYLWHHNCLTAKFFSGESGGISAKICNSQTSRYTVHYLCSSHYLEMSECWDFPVIIQLNSIFFQQFLQRKSEQMGEIFLRTWPTLISAFTTAINSKRIGSIESFLSTSYLLAVSSITTP